MDDHQQLLAAAALTAFRLNGQFLDLADRLARPAALTAAWWQVLGAVLDRPLPVAAVARDMGLTRQAVQRTADVLVDRGLARYRDNPAHRRAKLVTPTDAGRAAVAAIAPQHVAAARRLTGALGTDRLAEIVAGMAALSEALTALAPIGLAPTGLAPTGLAPAGLDGRPEGPATDESDRVARSVPAKGTPRARHDP